MAFDYDLEMTTELTPTQALHLLVTELDLEWGDDTHLKGMGLSTTALCTWDSRRAIIEQDFGFRPTLHVGFRPSGFDPEGEDRESYAMLAQAVAVLLRYSPCNAVLLCNSENVLLQRLSGKLVLNEGWGDWLRPQLDAAGLTYELRPLRSPALEENVPTVV